MSTVTSEQEQACLRRILGFTPDLAPLAQEESPPLRNICEALCRRWERLAKEIYQPAADMAKTSAAREVNQRTAVMLRNCADELRAVMEKL